MQDVDRKFTFACFMHRQPFWMHRPDITVSLDTLAMHRSIEFGYWFDVLQPKIIIIYWIYSFTSLWFQSFSIDWNTESERNCFGSTVYLIIVHVIELGPEQRKLHPSTQSEHEYTVDWIVNFRTERQTPNRNDDFHSSWRFEPYCIRLTELFRFTRNQRVLWLSNSFGTSVQLIVAVQTAPSFLNTFYST